MPIDEARLLTVLTTMRADFMANPESAIRSKRFINSLQGYCEYELNRFDFGKKKFKIAQEITLFGSHKTKDVDVAVLDTDNGPLIGISVKSQMSSIGKNFMGYYENIIGDSIGMHERYPFMVFSMLYLLPLTVVRKDKEGNDRKEKHNVAKIEQMFKTISNRKEWYDRPEKYEHFALLVVDFSTNPPKIIKTLPSDSDLKIDNFFDKIFATYKLRNPALDIL